MRLQRSFQLLNAPGEVVGEALLVGELVFGAFELRLQALELGGLGVNREALLATNNLLLVSDMRIEVLNRLDNDFRPLIIKFVELLASGHDQVGLQREHIMKGRAGQLPTVD